MTATAIAVTADRLEPDALVEGVNLLVDAYSLWDATDDETSLMLARLPESWDRCMSKAWYTEVEHRHDGGVATEYRRNTDPCHELGCPKCSDFHARSDLARWRNEFDAAYGLKRPLVVEFHAPEQDIRKFKRNLELLKKRRGFKRAVGPTVGFIHVTPNGYKLALMVRQENQGGLATVIRLWQDICPEGTSFTHLADTAAFETAVNMRVEGERAFFLLALDPDLDPRRVLERMRQARGLNRIVFGPGFRGKRLSEQRKPEKDDAENSAIGPVAENDAPTIGQEGDEGNGAIITCRFGHINCRQEVFGRVSWWGVEKILAENPHKVMEIGEDKIFLVSH